MDDNAHVHRARVVREYMKTDNIKHTEWPAQYPDLILRLGHMAEIAATLIYDKNL